MYVINYIGINNTKSLKKTKWMFFTGLKGRHLYTFVVLSFFPSRLPLRLALSNLHKFTIAIGFNLNSKVEVDARF
jgi:hypothetical protein